MITLLLALAAGLLSILSPCVLPLVPIVLGAAVSAHPRGAIALAAGLAVSFTGLGLLLAVAGFGFAIDAGAFHLTAAAIMILLGIVLLLPSLQARLAAAGGPLSGWAERHFGPVASSGAFGQFGIGLLLGAVWSPCVGPTLGAASLLAARGQDLPQVVLTMAAFGIGAGIPLVLLGLLSQATLMRLRARLTVAGKFGKGLLGAAFILVGVVIVSGVDKQIEALLVGISPQWLTQLTTSL